MSSIRLGIIHSPFWPGRPEGMSEEDFEIWQRFRESAIVTHAERIYFNTRLGGQTPPEGVDPAIARAWTDITAKRADVILEYPSRWIIIELRVRATSSVVGRLLMYRRLWTADPPDSRPVELMVVTDSIDKDAAELALEYGIKVVEV